MLNRQPVGICYNDAGSSNPALCDNLEGWDWVGGEKDVQEGGDICMHMADSS